METESSAGTLAISYQIADDLESQIRGGAFAVGARLPSQRELASFYGVAQNTARAALRVLADQGLVAAEQGRGVFVRAKYAVPDMDGHRVIESEWLEPIERGMLALTSNDPVYELVGRVFGELRAGLYGATFVDSWFQYSNHAVVEWDRGPSVKDVLVHILPSDTEDGSDMTGVPGLRAIRVTERGAELTWLPHPECRLQLRRLELGSGPQSRELGLVIAT